MIGAPTARTVERKRSTARLSLAGGALVVVLTATIGFVSGFAGASATGAPPVVVPLDAVGTGGVSGRVTLVQDDFVTRVSIRLAGGDGGYPADLSRGSCDALEALPLLPLADAVARQPTRTAIDIPLNDLLASPHAVVVRRPTLDAAALLDQQSVIGCADIRRTSRPVAPPTAGIGGVELGGLSGVQVALLLGLALDLAVVACLLRALAGRRPTGRP